MRAGLTDHRFDEAELLSKRLFLTHAHLPQDWREQYWGNVTTRVVPTGRRHDLRYAT
jgi:hypothetical protein